MNPWAPELSNKLVFYKNRRKTCVIDMNHSLKPLLICAGCLLVQLIQRGKLSADLIRRVSNEKTFGDDPKCWAIIWERNATLQQCKSITK